MKASDIDDFESLLEEAESQASTDWEMTFTSHMRSLYEQYGESCFVSDKQLWILERIAGYGL